MQDAFSLILSGWNPKCVFLMDRWILLLSFWISLLPQSWSRCFCKHFAIWKCRWKPPAIFCRNISDENHWHRFLRWKELGWNRNTSAPSSNYMALLLLMGFFCFATISLDMMEFSTNPWQNNPMENFHIVKSVLVFFFY